ncbi:MAG TPA: hypothetical protein VJJ73_00035 [Candidatus Paceibacterota bacterium]
MTQAIKQITKTDYNRHKFFIILLAVFCALVASYLYFFGVMIINMVEWRGASGELRTLSAKAQELEGEYFRFSSLLSIEKARELGFVDQDKEEFTLSDSASLFARR